MDDPTRFWLAQDGDARIEIAAETGTNPYGCPPYPDPELLDFGSATASVISEAGYAAADRLRRSLGCTGKEPPATSRLLRETERIREELLVLLGIPPAAGIAALLTASGTDAIRLASMLVWNESERPPDILAVAPEESGRGVPDALSAPSGGRYCPIRVRDPQGRLRPPGEVREETLAAAARAHAAGRPLFVILTDVSKTGLVVPGLPLLESIRQHAQAPLRVLVDACQLRLSSHSLNAYLTQGFMVALTGSKFLGGPSFSGALLVPRHFPGRLASVSTAPLPLGQLLRWEAALAELRRFSALQCTDIRAFLDRFSAAVAAHMEGAAQLKRLETLPPDRAPFGSDDDWDRVQTIFPFLLHRPAGQGGDPLTAEETMTVFRSLPRGGPDAHRTVPRSRLGQPVGCGVRGNRAVSALRLCVSARHAVSAVEGGAAQQRRIMAQACATLDAAARVAAELRE